MVEIIVAVKRFRPSLREFFWPYLQMMYFSFAGVAVRDQQNHVPGLVQDEVVGRAWCVADAVRRYAQPRQPQVRELDVSLAIRE